MRRIRLKKGARRQLYHEEYLQTPHWKETRSRAIARAGNRCQHCGATSRLEVHHLTYERLFCEQPEDLLVLCRSCHQKIHALDGEPAMLDLNSKRSGERFFTAINADSMEILALDVPFDQEEAQRLSDRAVMIIQACEAGEQFPRCAKDASWFECKMCQWQKRCWSNK